MDASVIHVSRTQMLATHKFPYFGYTKRNDEAAIIWIRNDLPPRVYKSVLAHEQQHAGDRNFKPLILWEARGWWAGLKASPLGFLQGILMSMTPERIGLYWRRWRDGF